MCRMFFKCSLKPFYINYTILKPFLATCRWRYFRKYDIFGHHSLGWGFAYLSENNKELVIKRDINPIYHADWESLTKIKTRFLLINISEKYLITHNGIIKNFPKKKLNIPKLDRIYKETDLDTRKYLCSIIDQTQEHKDLARSLEFVFKEIEIGAGANAFLFNSQICNVITNHNTNFNGRHHTLFISRNSSEIIVSTTPLTNNAKEIPNYSLIQIDLANLDTNFTKLDF